MTQQKIFNMILFVAALCIPVGLNADALPEVVTTNFTSTIAASSNVLKYRGSLYWYRGGLRGIAGSRVYSDDSSRNITYNPQEPSGKTWVISGTWQWATNGLNVSRVVFNDGRPADFYNAEVVSGHVLIDNEALLKGNIAFSNAVAAVAGASSAEPPDYANVSNKAYQAFEAIPALQNQINTESPLMARSFPVQQQDDWTLGEGSSTNSIYFRPVYFGMNDGDLLKGIVLRTRDSGLTPFTEGVYMRLKRYSDGQLLGISELTVWPNTSNTDVVFRFPQAVELTSSENYYMFDFSSSTNGAAVSFGMRLYVVPVGKTNPDFYFNISRLVPIATAQFYSWNSALSGKLYDFGTDEGLYAAVRDLVQALGGSVTNFPSGGGGSYTINTNGTVSVEGELNPDGTITIDGTLNPDGTVTVEAQ